MKQDFCQGSIYRNRCNFQGFVQAGVGKKGRFFPEAASLQEGKTREQPHTIYGEDDVSLKTRYTLCTWCRVTVSSGTCLHVLFARFVSHTCMNIATMVMVGSGSWLVCWLESSCV